jgi:hypothetical protein
MAYIGSINGAPQLAMPASPGPTEIQWMASDTVAAVSNPFTGQQQIQNWKASWLSATVTMPPMLRSQANAWIAFILAAQGQNAVFYFGDPLGATPQGSALGTPTTSGSTQQGYTLTTAGWTPNSNGLLLAGDYLQVGWRLYRCTDASVNSDSLGNASISIWPQIREVPANGTPITVNGAQGLFRLATNQRQWSESYMMTYGLSFQIREAI